MTLHPQHPSQRIRILLALCFPPTADQTNPDPASHQASPPGIHPRKRPARRRPGPESRSPAHQRSRAEDRAPRAAQPSVQPPEPSWPRSRLHRFHPGALPLFGRISRSPLPHSAPTSEGVESQSPLPLGYPPAPSDLGARRAHTHPAPLGPPGPPSSPPLPCPAHPGALRPSPTLPFPEPQRPSCTPLPRVRFPAPSLSLSLSPARLLLTTRPTRGRRSAGSPCSRRHRDWRSDRRRTRPSPPGNGSPAPACAAPASGARTLRGGGRDPPPLRAPRRVRAACWPGRDRHPGGPSREGGTSLRPTITSFSFRLPFTKTNLLVTFGHLEPLRESACRALHKLIQSNHSRWVSKETFGILMGDSEICPLLFPGDFLEVNNA